MVAIASAITLIDEELCESIRKVLHHSRFKRLEKSFLGIRSLFSASDSVDSGTKKLPDSRHVNIFVLDVSTDELRSDLVASSYKRTEVYRKLFNQRFDLLIGEKNFEIEGYASVNPFSLILVDFEFCFPKVTTPDSQIGLNELRTLSRIGQECFCMFLLGLAPQFFGEKFKSFGELTQVLDFKKIVERDSYLAWRDFRSQDESRMVGIALPRVVIRHPHERVRFKETGILFDEFEGNYRRDHMLWGNAAFAVVQPMLRSFLAYDWFADVSGFDRESTVIPNSHEIYDAKFRPGYDGGLIESLPRFAFQSGNDSNSTYTPTDFIVSEKDETAFSQLGFIPLYSINNSSKVAVLTNQAVQSPVEMSTAAATNNFRLSTLFNYMLCVCRMAHRLKIKCRTQIGGAASAKEFENTMHAHLMKYTSNRGSQLEQRMKKPFLNENTDFSAVEDVTDPGHYDCRISLCPHHKFDNGKTRIVFEPIVLEMPLDAQEDN